MLGGLCIVTLLPTLLTMSMSSSSSKNDNVHDIEGMAKELVNAMDAINASIKEEYERIEQQKQRATSIVSISERIQALKDRNAVLEANAAASATQLADANTKLRAANECIRVLKDILHGVLENTTRECREGIEQ
jgi:chromosome segregation ATPase